MRDEINPNGFRQPTSYNYTIDYRQEQPGSALLGDSAEPETDGGDTDIFPEKPTREKPADPKLSLILTQLAVCCLALLAAFALKLCPQRVFTPVREKYAALFQSPTSVNEVLSGMSKRLSLTDSSSGGAESSGLQATVSQTDATVSQESVPSEAADISKTAAEDTGTVSTPAGQGDGDFLPVNSAPMESTAASLPVAAATAAASETKGNAINQMAVPVSGEITSGFGFRVHPIYGKTLFHSGIDIGADTGTEILAALDGSVEEAGYSSSYGNYLIISHSDSVKTVYAHCSELLKSQGDKVLKEEAIARVGSTGVSTGPHLHFEVRVGGVCIDPRWVVDL